MYVYRSTRTVGKLYSEEVAQRWAAQAKAQAPHAWRVYTQGIGPRDTVVMEMEFESVAEMAPMIEAYLVPFHHEADQAHQEWWEKAGVPGGVDEIWNLYAAG